MAKPKRAAPDGPRRMERVAIYLRCSTNKQELVMQRDAVDRWLADLPADQRPKHRRIFQDEGRSGADDGRPGFHSMLAAAAAGEVDTVITYRLDRLTRSTVTALRTIMDLDQLGVAFIATSQPALNLGHGMPFRMTMLAAFAEIAQIEREAIVARVKDGIKSARARGVDWNSWKRLTPEQRAKVIELYEQGFTKKDIALGTNLSAMSVWKILKEYNATREAGWDAEALARRARLRQARRDVDI